MRLAIVGCGYVGERMVRALRGAGPPPLVTTRSEARAAWLRGLGADARVIEPTDRGALTKLLEGVEVVVDSVPPGPDGDPTQAIAAAVVAARVPVCVYLGSTGVYASAGGSVDEDSPVVSAGRGAVRLAAEDTLSGAARASGLRVVLLRISAIYGPGRGVQQRLRAGTHRVAGEGLNYISRIHVDDLAQVVLAAAQVAAADEPGRVRLYCVADDLPTTAREHADAVAAALALPPAPAVSVSEVPETLRGDRRVVNARMKRELSIVLRYPTWREGLAQSLDEEALAR